MIIRATSWLAIGVILVVLSGIAGTRLDWSIDFAWLFVAALAFCNPPELAPIAGLIFGLILDGLTGTLGFYTISYGGFGVVLLVLRRAFYLNGFVPGWILAVAGAELLWLFLILLSHAISMLGGSPRVVGYVSPFLLATLIGYPLVYWVSAKLLAVPVEPGRRDNYGITTRVIDKT